MELTQVNDTTKAVADTLPDIIEDIEVISSGRAFVEANTVGSTVKEIEEKHVIPVFIKDNEPVISHSQFISISQEVVKEIYHGEAILKPNIRLSHPIMGRIPEARNKPAKELLEHEKTIYYERMAFTIEVPSIHTDIEGNRLNLTIGGVKAYNLDNLYNKLGADQHFKLFIGFKNTVCTNLCISTDGFLSNLKVKGPEMLENAIYCLLKEFNAVQLGQELTELSRWELTEQQFALLIGRCRMYRYVPDNLKLLIPELQFGESQLNTICNDYYRDNAFCRSDNGNLTLWNLYNLFTGANKSTYIDSFLDRSVNAFLLVQELKTALQNMADCWYLN